MTMPNFLIIGAAKSGTSALWRYLGEHPDIFMSKKKEPHFFAYENSAPQLMVQATIQNMLKRI